MLKIGILAEVLVCVGKKWLFWFLKRWLVRWENQMCHLCGGLFYFQDV